MSIGLIVLFLLLHLLDVITTIRVLNVGGQELNPIARYCMSKFDPPWVGLVLLKLANLVLLYASLYWSTPATQSGVLVMLCVIYVFVVVHNMDVYESLRSTKPRGAP